MIRGGNGNDIVQIVAGRVVRVLIIIISDIIITSISCGGYEEDVSVP